jgi:hypothetical protein
VDFEFKLSDLMSAVREKGQGKEVESV